MRAGPLSEWLKQHDLERFLGVFEENEVDLTTLRMLSESDLAELGLPFGPRKRIINLLREEKSQENFGLKSGLPYQVDVSTSERRQLTVLFCDMVGGGVAGVETRDDVECASDMGWIRRRSRWGGSRCSACRG